MLALSQPLVSAAEPAKPCSPRELPAPCAAPSRSTEQPLVEDRLGLGCVQGYSQGFLQLLPSTLLPSPPLPSAPLPSSLTIL